MKRLVLIIVLLLSFNAYSQNLRPVRDTQSKKYGYQNERHKWIVSPQFDEAERFKDGFAKIKSEGLVGLINEKGKIVFAPQFDRIEKWMDGDVAQVYYNGKYGLINKKGQLLVKPQFDNIGKFDNNIAVVRLNKKYGVINILGNILAQPIYTEIGLFVNGTGKNISIINQDDKIGLMNISGQVIVEPTYDEIEPFVEKDQTYVKIGRLYGIISEKGESICKVAYLNKFDFNGMGVSCNAHLVDGVAYYGFVDSNFKEITPFDKPSIVREGDRFFVCETNKEKTIYNPKGELIKGGFTMFKSFSGNYINGGLIAVKNNNKWGFCDKNGNMVIDYKFDDVGSTDGKSFANGYCCVTIGQAMGFIDDKGNITITPRFNDEVNAFVADKNGNLTASIMYRGTQFQIRPDGSMFCEGTDVNADWTWASQMGLIKHSEMNKFGASPAGKDWILGRWIVVDEYQKDTGKVQGNKTGRIVYDFMKSQQLPDGSIEGALWITRRGKTIDNDGSVVYKGETTVHTFNFNGAEVLVDDVPMPVLQIGKSWHNIKIDDRLNSPQYVHLIKMVE